MKNGPPHSAVIAPTGISAGAIATRATRSAIDHERGAADQRRGQQQPMIRAEDQSQSMRNDQSDERNDSADGDRRADHDRGRDEDRAPKALHVNAKFGRRLVAETEQVQVARLKHQHGEAGQSNPATIATSR